MMSCNRYTYHNEDNAKKDEILPFDEDKDPRTRSVISMVVSEIFENQRCNLNAAAAGRYPTDDTIEVTFKWAVHAFA